MSARRTSAGNASLPLPVLAVYSATRSEIWPARTAAVSDESVSGAGDGRIRAKRYINSGKALATVKVKGLPALVTTRPKIFELRP